MRIQAKHTSGLLDISHRGIGEGKNYLPPLNICLKPDEIIEVLDMYRGVINIDTAISQGLLVLLDYDTTRGGDLVVEDELLSPTPTPTTLELVAFKAYPSKHMAISGEKTVEFETIDEDNHNGYDIAKFKYSFPHTGLWELTAKITCLVEKEGDYLYVDIWHTDPTEKPDSKKIAEGMSEYQAAPNRYVVVTVHCWVTIRSTADSVYVTSAYAPNGTIQEELHKSFFSGRLIQNL